MAGRTCLIVGGTGGIGLASARRFLAEGARVVVTGLTDIEANHALASLGTVGALACDVTDPGSVEAAFGSAIELFGGRLDVLFHVAGISGRRFGDGPLHECSPAGWDAVMDANARGTFLTNQRAVRQMLGQGRDAFGLRGTVVNTGSVLAKVAITRVIRHARLCREQGGRPRPDPRLCRDLCRRGRAV